MKHVIELETEVEDLKRERRHTAKDASGQIDKLQAELVDLREAENSKQGFVDQLRDELEHRSKKMAQQEAEYIESKLNAKRLEKKVEDVAQQLANAEDALAQTMRNSSYKDQLVREMTEQVNISETKLHAYQISEVLGSRQRQLEQEAMNGEASESWPSKEKFLNSLATETTEPRSRVPRLSGHGDNLVSSLPPSDVVAAVSGGGSFGQLRGVPPGGLCLGATGPSRRASGMISAADLDITGNSYASGAATPDSSHGMCHTPNSYRSHQFSQFTGLPRMVSSPPSFWPQQAMNRGFPISPTSAS